MIIVLKEFYTSEAEQGPFDNRPTFLQIIKFLHVECNNNSMWRFENFSLALLSRLKNLLFELESEMKTQTRIYSWAKSALGITNFKEMARDTLVAYTWTNIPLLTEAFYFWSTLLIHSSFLLLVLFCKRHKRALVLNFNYSVAKVYPRPRRMNLNLCNFAISVLT